MFSRPFAVCQCVFALGLCFCSSGCILFGAYPVVQDTTRQLYEVRVADAESNQAIPDAKVALDTDWDVELAANYDSADHRIKVLNDERPELDEVVAKKERQPWWLPNQNLKKNENGTFSISRRYEMMPGVIGICFADGPGYIGPFSEHDSGVFGRSAVVTAWAPGYTPMQIVYDVKCSTRMLNEQTGREYQYDPDRGALTLYLRKASQAK